MKWTRIAAGWVAGVMDWWLIRIEPVPLPERARAVGPCYELCLPLIPDGRISLALFRSEPGRATFRHARKGTTSFGGQIEFRDNQWICVHRRRSPGRAEVRIMCRRFALGDLVGLRSAGSPITFYRVKRKELVLPGSGG